jgi:putative DNA primase/helicase
MRERLDILGDRGYAVVPPSRVPCTKPVEEHEPGHCTGGYTWTDRRSMATLPEWVAALARERHWTPQPMRDAIRNGGRTTYGQAAIDGEAARVVNAEPGSRNNTLNSAAWRLGRLAGGDEVDPQHAVEALWEAARACGLVDDDGAGQVMRTIDSGLRAGMQRPRTRPAVNNNAPEAGTERDGEPRRSDQRNRGISL